MKIISPQKDSSLILVVDDDKFMRLQLRRAMEQAGYQVAEASDGAQALAAYTKLHPDIVLLDALMPVMDGFTCCTQLHKLPGGATTPVLMITALEDQESVDQAFEIGATDYITKPIHWAVLRQRVRRLLQANRTMKELRQQTERAQLSEERLRLALEAAQMGSWDWDILTNKVSYSYNLGPIFGLPPGSEHPTYEAFLNAVHPEDRDRLAQAAIRAVEEGAEYGLEFRLIWPDGTVHWIGNRGQVYYDNTSRPIRMAGIAMDITARKQAEEELRQNEEFLRRIIKTSPDCIKVLDLEGRLLSMSAGGQSLLEIDDFSSVKNSQWVNFWQGIHNQAARSAIETAKAGGSGKFQGYCPTAKGTPKWWEVVVTPLKDAEGKPEKLLSVSRDITERKQSEEALRESEARFRRLVESNIIGIIFADTSGNISIANNAFLQMVGYTQEELDSGQVRWDKMTPPEYRYLDEHVITELRKFGVCNCFEKEYIRKDGSRVPVVVGGALVEGSQDQAICFVLDITERKRAEEELQRQNKRSQLFADVTLKIRQSLQLNEILQTTVTEVQKVLQADRVLIYRLWPDRTGSVVTEAVVPGWPTILGQAFPAEVFPDEYRDLYSQGRVRAIENVENADVPPCLVEFLQQWKAKAKLVVPIFLKQELWGLMITHQCSSPRQWTSPEIELLRQLADQIGIALAQSLLLDQETHQSQELARSNAELQQFASIASHDLQEPLRKIQAFGNRLKDKYSETLTEQGLDYLERMQNAAQRMQALIDDLLILSRITSKGHSFATVNLTQVTKEVLSDLELRIQQTEGRVEIGELPTIDADPLQMRQLLQNLISNALKFHRDNEPPIVKIYSQLLVGQERQSGEDGVGTQLCQIILEDNGIGFDEKYLDRIFNVFQRLHTRSEYEGTGMGLAICRKIAERHGGSITAKSAPGEGAKFIVTLPMKQRRGEKPSEGTPNNRHNPNG